MKRGALSVIMLVIIISATYGAGWVGGSMNIHRDVFKDNDYNVELAFNQFGFGVGGAHYFDRSESWGLRYQLGFGSTAPKVTIGSLALDLDSTLGFYGSVGGQFKHDIQDELGLDVGIGYAFTNARYTNSNTTYSYTISKIELTTGVVYELSDTIMLGGGLAMGFPLGVSATTTVGDNEPTTDSAETEKGFGFGGYLGAYYRY
ncbi:MAG: hypothetical protein PHU24_05780 [Sphaerochaetaceae bacterium]|jgi:hypothetical protein|nr:hypothetical protein [Sphaerochaetaceae bacterium]NLO60465.1 hypothetical protein [Spirochaetales bacterium]MDD2405945.1 hypothetical protein [Sphaerochaetaceae bacterium]MDD3670774.1 hypothetical protein [Sphaerochaetaceae bacterium]MDD4260462.1 hypothetical protein [Sphaerochaetaceae bacterium]